MKWEQGDFRNIRDLRIGGRVVAAIRKLPSGSYYAYVFGQRITPIRDPLPSEEAAMQAAESAVREWLGKAIEEVVCTPIHAFDGNGPTITAEVIGYELPEVKP